MAAMDPQGARRRGRRQADEDRRTERTQVFQKTKMCKFHLMGSCQRGSDCRFAHDQSELQTLPDLARTKICKQLLLTGLCEDPNCSYAHSREEYRVVPGFSAADHREAEMQLHQLDGMKRAGRLPGSRPLEHPEPKAEANGQKHPLAPQMYQGNLLACATPVLFVPSLQSMVPPGGDAFPPVLHGGLPNSPCHDKPPAPLPAPGPVGPQSALKETPLAPGTHPQPFNDRLQAMTQFMQPPGGPFNGYSHSGLGPFEGRSTHRNEPPRVKEDVRVSRGHLAPGIRNQLAMPEDDMPFSPSEPAQIKLGSLRSLSSNSLPVQVDDDDDLPDRGMPNLGMGMPPMSGMNVPMTGQQVQALKVKNTFLDLDTDCTPLGQRLRPICSAAGRLDALADEEDAGLGGPLASSLAPGPSVISPNSAPPGVGDFRSHVGSLSPSSDPFRRDLGAPDGMGSLFTVKNTFIECEEPPVEGVSLRAVHTAAGRLDTMWRDEEDRFD